MGLTMLMRTLLLACLLGASLGAGAQQAAPDVRPAVEVTFPSAEPGVMLTAYWAAPQPSDKPAAAVVALHGCNGLPADRTVFAYPRHRYIRLLNDAGAGVLYVDSFGSRGQGDLCAQKPSERSISEVNRRLDVLGAMQWLAAKPEIDARRLGVVGWSHGGQTVLSVADASAEVVQQALVKPAALVAFYPGCNTFEKSFRYEAVAPLLVMSGELDDWTPAAPCKRLTDRLQSGKHLVRYVQYEGSYHAFDSARPVVERGDVGGTKSGKAKVGGNPAAREASALELMRFFGEHLKLTLASDLARTAQHAQPVPAFSGFAAVADVQAVPKLSERGQALYHEWLAKPFPRAIAISDKGAMARGYGPDAMRQAVQNCERLSAQVCRLYAVDGHVVWVKE